jgi:hypothetical protein
VGGRAAQGQSGEYKILLLQAITPRLSGSTVLPVAIITYRNFFYPQLYNNLGS